MSISPAVGLPQLAVLLLTGVNSSLSTCQGIVSKVVLRALISTFSLVGLVERGRETGPIGVTGGVRSACWSDARAALIWGRRESIPQEPIASIHRRNLLKWPSLVRSNLQSGAMLYVTPWSIQ